MPDYDLGKVMRPLFRATAKDEQERYAQAIEAAPPSVETFPTGGSLARAVRKLRPKITRWGYVMPYHLLGQKLTWFVRGTSHQRPRPVVVHPRVDALAEQAQDAIVRAFAAWDLEVRA